MAEGIKPSLWSTATISALFSRLDIANLFFAKADGVLGYTAAQVDDKINELSSPSHLMLMRKAGILAEANTNLPMSAYTLALSAHAYGDGTAYYSLFYFAEETTITGAHWYNTVAGVYNANNYNGIAIGSVAAGVYTEITRTVDDGNIWKNSNLGTKAFPTPVVLAAGVYAVWFLYSTSDAPAATPPQMSKFGDHGSAPSAVFLSNSLKLNGYLASQTDLTTPVTMSTTTANSVTHGIWLY